MKRVFMSSSVGLIESSTSTATPAPCEALSAVAVEPHHLGDGGREVDGGLPWGVVVIVPVDVIVVGMGMLIVTMAGLR
jgi:hypothetical protein